MVENIIELLHLQDCADVLIGNEILKGISGGEKKRTAIGVELVTRPSILFLDEPTSGLDSWAAYQVIKNLKELSERGCTILTTIHQPSTADMEFATTQSKAPTRRISSNQNQTRADFCCDK